LLGFLGRERDEKGQKKKVLRVLEFVAAPAVAASRLNTVTFAFHDA
jgi:hypothetical protein